MDVMKEMELKIDCDVLIYIHYFNKSTKMQLEYHRFILWSLSPIRVISFFNLRKSIYMYMYVFVYSLYVGIF